MGEPKDGGPAFPTEPNTQPGFYLHHGMSLRDWFAGQALVGLVADNNLPRGAKLHGVTTADEFRALIADAAYAIADAMLAARALSSAEKAE